LRASPLDRVVRRIRPTFDLNPDDRARAYTRAPVGRRKPTAIAGVLDLLHQLLGRAFSKVEIALVAARKPRPQSLCHVSTLDQSQRGQALGLPVNPLTPRARVRRVEHEYGLAPL